MKGLRFRAAMMCTFVLLSGCGLSIGSNKPVKTPDVTRSAGGPGEPHFEIVSPKFGATVHGGNSHLVPILISVQDFKLVDKIGQPAQVGEGHVIYYRLESTDARIPATQGKTAIKGGRGVFTSVPVAKVSYAWPFMPDTRFYPPGFYTFVVQLVNNDDMPLSPPKVAFVRVDVEQ